MKTLLIIWTCLCTGLCMAQTSVGDGTHVTVHAGENALETLLTEEQKQSVKYLTVTGTLLPEDYVFLRNTCLDEIDLSETDIDTIPENAFQDYVGGNENTGKIILPRNLKFIKDRAFNTSNFIILVLTGDFPEHTENSFENQCNNRLSVSQDNPYCKEEDHTPITVDDGIKEFDTVLNSVYSTDGSIFYYSHLSWWQQYDAIQEIHPGTRIIAGGAFAGVEWCEKYVFPATLDSIGHDVFYKYGISCPIITCYAPRPPKWEKDELVSGGAFRDCGQLIVPEESEERYRNAPLWGRAAKINGKGYEILPSVSTVVSNRCSISDYGSYYLIISSVPINRVRGYDINGRCLYNNIAHGSRNAVKLNKSPVSCNVFQIFYSDKTNEVVKLIP